MEADKDPPGAWCLRPLWTEAANPPWPLGADLGSGPGGAGRWHAQFGGHEMSLSLTHSSTSSVLLETSADHPLGAGHCAGLWGRGGGRDGHDANGVTFYSERWTLNN